MHCTVIGVDIEAVGAVNGFERDAEVLKNVYSGIEGACYVLSTSAGFCTIANYRE